MIDNNLHLFLKNFYFKMLDTQISDILHNKWVSNLQFFTNKPIDDNF